jgi:hypothetical protein
MITVISAIMAGISFFVTSQKKKEKKRKKKEVSIEHS